MRRRFIALCMSLLCAATAAPSHAAVSVSIGINVPVYPRMVVVPGYPVYYAPGLGANFFFYDGMYWVLQGDHWYMSSWYNGPWAVVEPAYVPYDVLRVPVRFYRAPPPYFRGWQPSAPPRWGSHWGPQWEQRHRDWNRRDRRATPGPAPLPSYQRRYAGDRYPGPVEQANLQTRNYRYQPRTEVARQHLQQQVPQQRPERRGPAVAQQRPPMEQPHVQRSPHGVPSYQQGVPSYQQGVPSHQQGVRSPQQVPPRQQVVPPHQQVVPPHQQERPTQHSQPGRAEQQERGRGKGQGDDGRDKREEAGPRGK